MSHYLNNSKLHSTFDFSRTLEGTVFVYRTIILAFNLRECVRSLPLPAKPISHYDDRKEGDVPI